MIDERELLEQAMRRFEPEPGLTERIYHRRDRKRRNQRITAGVVGIAVLVAAIWIVTTGGPFDRSETPAATGPVETAPAPAPALAAPDVVKQRTCSEGARSRLELTDVGRTPDQVRVRMRFEVHRSPPGHWWRITLHANRPGYLSPNPRAWRPSVASDSGDLAVQVRWGGVSGWFLAKAVDTQTGQVCEVRAWYR